MNLALYYGQAVRHRARAEARTPIVERDDQPSKNELLTERVRTMQPASGEKGRANEGGKDQQQPDNASGKTIGYWLIPAAPGEEGDGDFLKLRILERYTLNGHPLSSFHPDMPFPVHPVVMHRLMLSHHFRWLPGLVGRTEYDNEQLYEPGSEDEWEQAASSIVSQLFYRGWRYFVRVGNTGYWGGSSKGVKDPMFTAFLSELHGKNVRRPVNVRIPWQGMETIVFLNASGDITGKVSMEDLPATKHKKAEEPSALEDDPSPTEHLRQLVTTHPEEVWPYLLQHVNSEEAFASINFELKTKIFKKQFLDRHVEGAVEAYGEHEEVARQKVTFMVNAYRKECLDNGEVPPSAQNFPPWVKLEESAAGASIDARYLEAVENGDIEAAQHIVDKAARDAGYNIGPVYHASDSPEFASFDIERAAFEARYGRGFYFSNYDKEPYGKNVRRFYLRLLNPANGFEVGAELNEPKNGDLEFNYAFREELMEQGFDGVEGPEEVVVFTPHQIKLADAVVKDDAGNIIPPSRRFDPNSSDVRESKKLEEASYFDLWNATRRNGDYKYGGMRKIHGRWIYDPTVPGRTQNGKRFVTVALPKVSLDDEGRITINFRYQSRPTRNTTGISHVGYVKFSDHTSFLKTASRNIGKAMAKRDVHTRCSCPDFQFRWHWVLSQIGAAPEPTGPGNLPPNKTNPQKKIAMCKHLCAVSPFLLFRSPAFDKEIRKAIKTTKKAQTRPAPNPDEPAIVKDGAKIGEDPPPAIDDGEVQRKGKE